MKLSVLFSVNAVVATLFGIAFVLIPGEVVAAYGLTLSPSTAVIARFFGAALIGFGIITWQARAAAPSDALRAIVLALFVSDALGFVLALRDALTGAVNALGWSTVAIYGLLGAGFGSFAFKKSAAAGRS
jgi:hypothetical protein